MLFINYKGVKYIDYINYRCAYIKIEDAKQMIESDFG
jgi:hypothetical protein